MEASRPCEGSVELSRFTLGVSSRARAFEFRADLLDCNVERLPKSRIHFGNTARNGVSVLLLPERFHRPWMNVCVNEPKPSRCGRVDQFQFRLATVSKGFAHFVG